jgi:hypothetical protein
MRTKFWFEILKERAHSEDLGVDGKMILKWILEKRGWGVDCIHLAHNMNRWWALANTVMNLLVP